jgi:hypothetical protein
MQIKKIALLFSGLAVVIYFAARTVSSSRPENAVADASKAKTDTTSRRASASTLSTTHLPVSRPAPNSALRGTPTINDQLRSKLRLATDLAQFLVELEAMPNVSTQDKTFYRAMVNEYCFVQVEQDGISFAGSTPLPPPPSWGQESMRSNVKATPQIGDPKKAIREQALQTWKSVMPPNLCVGFKKGELTKAGIERTWRTAAQTVDVRSIAMLSDAEFRNSAGLKDWSGTKNFSGKPLPSFYELPDPSSEHIARITAALSTQDPLAIIDLGGVFSESFKTQEFNFGAGNEVILPNLRDVLWPLLACEFGYPCQPDNNTELMRICARQGQCELPDLESYYRSYQLS